MEKRINKLLSLLLVTLCANGLYAQVKDSMAYSLINHTIGLHYSELKKEKGSREILEDGTYRDTLFYIYIDAEPALPSEGRDIDSYVLKYTRLLTEDYTNPLIKEGETPIFKADAFSMIYLNSGTDTLTYGSVKTQLEQSMLFKQWDCDRINEKFICTNQYVEERRKSDYTIYPKQVDRYKDYPSYNRKFAELNPVKYGLRLAYPAFFEYEGVLYGFNYIQYRYFMPREGQKGHAKYFLSRWTGSAWETMRFYRRVGG